jgi:hypothetical protein
MPQAIGMTFHIDQSWRYLRWPYQAKVIKVLERMSSKTAWRMADWNMGQVTGKWRNKREGGKDD